MSLVRTSLAAVLFALSLAANASDPSDRIELGRQLFEENWLRPPADDSPLAVARSGDGLGPLFNGASCVECHFQGGVGGAGPNEHNVEIVSLALPLDAAPDLVRAAMKSASEAHPGFREETNVFLHRFGLDDGRTTGVYELFHGPIRSQFPEEVVPARQTEQVLHGGLPYQLAQRNTTALWGLGTVEKIPPKLVQEVAARQREAFPALAGVATDGGAGRFGWRGHVSSVDQFVRTACAEELGMRVKDRSGTVHDQPAWPVGNRAAQRRVNPPVDLTPKQVDGLVAFIRSLPEPRQVVPEDSLEALTAREGRQTFEALGCSVCHLPDLGPAVGIYSDMLMHDMGAVFADRVAAPLDQSKPRVVTETGVQAVPIRTGGGGGGGGGGYGGSSSAPMIPITSIALVPTTKTVVIPPSLNDLTMATQAFRTPALWGVADSAPYLHDGRAETLDEAIRLHAGQAAPVAAKYAASSEQDRNRVLAFLGTLRAPSAN